MQQTDILLPVTALALLTLLVAVRMLLQRLGEMRSRRIHPEAMATSVQRAQRLQSTSAADNFANLFELPVLFYVLCLALLATGTVSEGFLWASWAFVLLRVAHSVVHCSYNRVVHRFAAYLAGFAVLGGMWVAFAVRVLGS